MTIRAAGVLIIDTAGRALFLKRGPGGDAAGLWCFPGGKIEEGESPLEAAIREVEEESGHKLPAKALMPWTRRVAPTGHPVPAPAEPVALEEVDFTTFLASGVEPFTPELGPKEAPEHVAYAWAPIDHAPEPLHPGCRVALQRFNMDELDLARAIVAGDLTSPQHYKNVALYAIRITGTGAAYRPSLKEYVWRDPSIFLNEEFLARCNGLPVVWIHPPKATLDSKEFGERIVGTILLPFIKGDEVWGIAKIYDDEAKERLETKLLSTSPGVVIREADSEELKLENGTTLLIEGKPALLDHIAIVEAGVWDKGGPPTGVSSTEVKMADDKNGTEGRLDAAKVMEKLDSISSRIDSAHARLDSIERKDAEDKERADKDRADAEAKEKEEKEKADARKKRHDAARKDRFGKRHDGEKRSDYVKRHDADEKAMCDALRADGESEEEAREDAARARRDAEEDEKRSDESFEKWAKEEGEEAEHRKDAERADALRRADAAEAEAKELKGRLAALEQGMKTLTTEVPADERNALAAAQYRADSVMAMFGERASQPLPGETSLSYRKRLLGKILKHSPKMKDARLDSADGVVLETIENQVYADAAEAARRADSATPGMLIPVYETDAAGRRITKYHGDNLAWMAPFMRGGQVGRIIRNPKAN